MSIDKAAELAKPAVKTNNSKLSAADRLLLQLSDEYVPADSGNWSPVPSSVVEALDQLAARIKALEP